MLDVNDIADGGRVWRVGALCRAIADALGARFNPVDVSGEISGFSRATSGHCYFVLKDESGQLRCAMFRRAAGMLNFTPKDGERVEVQGRLGVYEPRGELQLVVESMRRAGQGTLFEQFLLRKEKLEREGLFDPERKRPVSAAPRGVGLVTSLGAAALHDVVTALQRRVPHIPVVLAPAAVQGEGAPRELVQALESLYAMAEDAEAPLPIDTILLVRGGGSMEDLWAFNDELLARTIAKSPVPLICGVGHETDFTIADFVADLRAPTPTAAAELVATPTQVRLDDLARLEARVQQSLERRTQREAQRLDQVNARIGRPSTLAHRRRLRLASLEQGLSHATRGAVNRQTQRLAHAALRLELLDPSLVLRRGYAWITGDDGRPIVSIAQVKPGQQVVASLADGAVDLTVLGHHAN